MSDTVKLRAKLPAHEDNNGFDYVVDDLLQTPETVRCAFIWYSVSDIRENVATGNRVPTLEIRKAEPLPGDAKSVPVEIRNAVMAMADKRLGKQALPFDQVERISSEGAE